MADSNAGAPRSAAKEARDESFLCVGGDFTTTEEEQMAYIYSASTDERTYESTRVRCHYG